MKGFRKIALLILLAAAAVSGVTAETLFDFSTSDCGWRSNSASYMLQRSEDYPFAGRPGLLFSGPAWDRENQIWPAFETGTLPGDWSKYDRLVITVFNDSPVKLLFDLFISDSATPFRQGAVFKNQLLPYSSNQLVLKLQPKLSAKVDPTDIAVIHCFTENPESELRLFISDFTLLEPGEDLPAPPDDYRRQILERQRAILTPRIKKLEAEAETFDLQGVPDAAATGFRDRIADRLEKIRRGEADEELLATGDGLPLEWSSVRSIFAVLRAIAAGTQPVAAAPGYGDVILGYATPMEKILPHVPIFQPLPEQLEIDVARNEKEAVQLIVLPLRQNLSNVQVKPGDFTGSSGTLPTNAVSVAPVGFVETTFVPRSGSEYVGFWPDPLLAFLDQVEIRTGEAQPFWLRADIPSDQPAGVYNGRAEVVIDGSVIFSVPLTIRVRDFTLPERSSLPLAVTFWPSDGQIAACNPNYDPEARESAAAPVHSWRKHLDEWSEMLAGYYLTVDSLYEYPGWTPEFELFSKLKREGRLGVFNLGYFPPASENPADNYGMQKTIERIRPRYERAKQLELLDNAYLYGCDECIPDKFPSVNRAAAILKREFPGVPIFTTSYDNSFGGNGQLDSIDWFCPLTSAYNPELAAAARRAGKQVWWYICLVPPRPYANNFIESSGIETRLLTGAMSAKYRPDGFLYYQTSLWNNTEPITSGPYTDWIAQSFPGYNGDGSWTYPGPDGTPLGSIRLENFRDGLEDFAYVKLLEEKFAAAEKIGVNHRWCREAAAALAVPARIVTSLTEYTRNPAELYQWRSRLAELIETAPEI